MLFKSGVWESLSDFQFCGGGGNGRGKLTKCPNYFVRGCSWVVGDCYHTAQFFLFHAFFFTLYLGSFNDRSYDRVKGLRTRLKLRCFPEQFIPHYSIYVGTSHSGCALLRLPKLWLDKSVLAACRRGSECTVLFVGLCVRAALERNMSPNIFFCLGTSWFCLCVLLLCLRVLCRGFAPSSLWHDLFQVYDWKTSCPCTILRITSNFSPISPFLSGHWVILFISFLDNKDINKEIPHPLYWQPAFSVLNI